MHVCGYCKLINIHACACTCKLSTCSIPYNIWIFVVNMQSLIVRISLLSIMWITSGDITVAIKTMKLL